MRPKTSPELEPISRWMAPVAGFRAIANHVRLHNSRKTAPEHDLIFEEVRWSRAAVPKAFVRTTWATLLGRMYSPRGSKAMLHIVPMNGEGAPNVQTQGNLIGNGAIVSLSGTLGGVTALFGTLNPLAASAALVSAAVASTGTALGVRKVTRAPLAFNATGYRYGSVSRKKLNASPQPYWEVRSISSPTDTEARYAVLAAKAAASNRGAKIVAEAFLDGDDNMFDGICFEALDDGDDVPQRLFVAEPDEQKRYDRPEIPAIEVPPDGPTGVPIELAQERVFSLS